MCLRGGFLWLVVGSDIDGFAGEVQVFNVEKKGSKSDIYAGLLREDSLDVKDVGEENKEDAGGSFRNCRNLLAPRGSASVSFGL